MYYLINTKGAPEELYPRENARKRAEQDMWLAWNMASNRPAYMGYIGLIVKQVHGGEVADGFFDAQLEKIAGVNAFVEAHLVKKGTTYLTGEHLTLADIAVFTEITSAEIIKKEVKGNYLKPWYDRVAGHEKIAPIFGQIKEMLASIHA